MDETNAKTKVCRFCGRELTLDHYNKSTRAKDGHQCYCRECQALMNKERNIRLKAEKATAKAAAPKEAPKPVLKRANLSDFTPQEIFAYLESIGYRWHEKSIWREEVIVKRDFVVPSGRING